MFTILVVWQAFNLLETKRCRHPEIIILLYSAATIHHMRIYEKNTKIKINQCNSKLLPESRSPSGESHVSKLKCSKLN